VVPVLRALPDVLILNGVIELAVFGLAGVEGIAVDQLPATLVTVIVHAVAFAETADDAGHGFGVELNILNHDYLFIDSGALSYKPHCHCLVFLHLYRGNHPPRL
jgi:hypothetical protein